MLLLDSEAISAIAHGPRERRDKVRALIAIARAKEHSVGTVAAVLAEVVRGRPRDAAVFAGLRRERVQVHRVDTRVGVRAGQLLGQTRMDSAAAIDALVVAVGDLAGGAVIATVDVADLRRLRTRATGIAIADVT